MSSQPTPITTSAISVATSRNPATDELIATSAFQTAEKVERLLVENNAAFRLWRAMPMSERVVAYRRLSAILRERSDSLAGIITAEMGKTLAAARAEVEKCAATNARIPIGGVKKSGYGRELSHFGLREFTNAQAVWAKKID